MKWMVDQEGKRRNGIGAGADENIGHGEADRPSHPSLLIAIRAGVIRWGVILVSCKKRCQRAVRTATARRGANGGPNSLTESRNRGDQSRPGQPPWRPP